ncbi:pilus assembly protein PilM [Xylanimonas ulmi]
MRAAEVEVHATRSGSHATLLRFGEEPLDPGAIRDGEVVRQAPVALALRTLWRRERLRCKNVVLGVGNQRVFVRDLCLPGAPLERLRSTLRYQPVQDLLPVRVEDCLLDFHPVRVDDDGAVHGMLIAAPEETVDANTSAVVAAGLRPVRVDLNAFGLTRSIIHGRLREEVVGVVDIGATITDIIVVDHGVLRMYRTLATGSDDMTSAVRHATALTEQQAEEVKRHFGITSPPDVPTDVAPGIDAMARRARALGESIRTSFGYYAASAGRPVVRLLLTGRGAQTPGLAQYLSTSLGLPTAFGVAGSEVEVARTAQGHDLTGDLRTSLPVALGLALGVAA